MGNKGLSDLVLSVVHKYLRDCPICLSETPDLRFRHAFGIFTNTPPCHVYRSSRTSVTLECRTCTIRYTVTWRSLTTTLKTRLRLEQNSTDQELINALEILEQEVDTKYSTRKPPIKQNTNYGR